LNKTIPGTRISYEILCEFLHPNVGDLLASIVDAGSFFDTAGTKHLEITLGAGKPNFKNTPDVERVLAQAIEIVAQVVTLIPSVDRQLKQITDRIGWRTKRVISTILKQHKTLFEGSDLCPCQSGRSVGTCCQV
jgi:uncharacterized protein YecA (UPF0149 family)